MSDAHASLLIADMGFADVKVGSRIRKILKREGIETLDQLLELTEHRLRLMPGLGIISIIQIKQKLAGMNLALKDPTW